MKIQGRVPWGPCPTPPRPRAPAVTGVSPAGMPSPAPEPGAGSPTRSPARRPRAAPAAGPARSPSKVTVSACAPAARPAMARPATIFSMTISSRLLGKTLEQRLGVAPADALHEGVDVGGGPRAVVHLIGVLIHIERQD